MDRDEIDALAATINRRLEAMERRQDDWIANANRTLVDLREETERHLRKLGRMLETLDDTLTER